jgi:hypothetical protein
MKKRTGEPWITAPDYGRLLPSFSVNLLVRDVARSIESIGTYWWRSCITPILTLLRSNWRELT